MIQKSTTFTTIFRVKKYYFHYDFSCKKSVTFTTIFRVKKCLFQYDMQKMFIQLEIEIKFFR
jgi:hypothetical protein